MSAIDIVEQIDAEVDDARHRVESVLTLQERLLMLVDLSRRLDPVSVRWLRDLAQGWVQRIRGHLDPPRRLHIAARCPACNARSVMVRNPDTNEHEQKPALQVDGVHGCVCLACHHAWPTTHLHHLASVIEQQLAEDTSREAARITLPCPMLQLVSVPGGNAMKKLVSFTQRPEGEPFAGDAFADAIGQPYGGGTLRAAEVAPDGRSAVLTVEVPEPPDDGEETMTG